MDYIVWIVIPLSAGVVGYLTNALAIRMLFRPFKAHWYTLGWQGIIPRTRTDLAYNIGKVVAEKLVTEEEINAAMSSEHFMNALYGAVYKLLSGHDSPRSKRYFSKKAKLVLEKFSREITATLLENNELQHSLDAYTAKILRKAVAGVFGLRVKAVAGWANQAGQKGRAEKLAGKLRLLIEKEIKKSLHSAIYSGKNISELAGTKIDADKLAGKATAVVMPMLLDILSRRQFLDRLTQILIEYKNEQFSGGSSMTDMLKRGALNMFLSDERIEELVHTKAPELADKITTDKGIHDNIKAVISAKIKELIEKPLSAYADDMGENYHVVLHHVASVLSAKVIPLNFNERLGAYAASDDERTIGEVLHERGIEIDGIVPPLVPVSELLLSGGGSRYLTDVLSGSVSNISHINLSEGQVQALSTALTGWSAQLLRSFIPQTIKHLNIADVVEEKINSLDAREVEDMLFSFMKAHFRWINLLGFIIGAIVGFAQVAFIKMFS